MLHPYIKLLHILRVCLYVHNFEATVRWIPGGSVAWAATGGFGCVKVLLQPVPGPAQPCFACASFLLSIIPLFCPFARPRPRPRPLPPVAPLPPLPGNASFPRVWSGKNRRASSGPHTQARRGYEKCGLVPWSLRTYFCVFLTTYPPPPPPLVCLSVKRQLKI